MQKFIVILIILIFYIVFVKSTLKRVETNVTHNHFKLNFKNKKLNCKCKPDLKSNIEEEIVSKGSSISEFIENGYFCFNYHVADNRFNDNYNDLHKLIPIFLEVAIEESSYFHIFHIPSNEYLSIDEIPDIEGSEGMMKEFIIYI